MIRGRLSSGLAVLALAAMLGAIALHAADPAIAGLDPDHGHVSIDGGPPHEHDHTYGEDAGDEDGLVFTFARDGSVAGAALVPAPPSVTLLAPVAPGPAVSSDAMPRSLAPAPSPEPPRA